MKSRLHWDMRLLEERYPLKRKARAKINWTLDITGVREDGYHLLDTLIQPLDLHDLLYLRPADTLSLRIAGGEGLSAGSDNLVIRAAQALQQYTRSTKGAEMVLIKHIPMGAGLGGGSADAAAAMKGLNALWGTDVAFSALKAIGETIGADVPYCLTDAPSRAQGIGEVLTPITGLCVPLLLIQPCGALSTRDVYARYHQEETIRRPDTEGALWALQHGNINRLRQFAANVLESASIPVRPEIAQAKEACYRCGAGFAQMTGSGSVVFAVFSDKNAACAAYRQLREQYGVCLLTQTAC